MPCSTYQPGAPEAADSWIESANPTTNYGSEETLQFGYDLAEDSAKRAILEFDLSEIRAGRLITQAYLYLRISTASAIASPAYIDRLTQTGWKHLEITWNAYASGQAWTSVGGDFDTANRVSFNLPTSTGDFEVYNLEPMVQDAIDNRSGILRIGIRRATEAVSDGFCVARSSDFTSNPGRRPAMSVCHRRRGPIRSDLISSNTPFIV